MQGTLEMGNLSHINAAKHKKKTLKELTTKTERVLPDLSFLPLQRRILNFNGH